MLNCKISHGTLIQHKHKLCATSAVAERDDLLNVHYAFKVIFIVCQRGFLYSVCNGEMD